MRLPPAAHLAHLLRTRDGGYVYDTLQSLAGEADRPDLAAIELELAERDDALSLLAVATYGYSPQAVGRAYQRASDDQVRLAVAANGFPRGSGWCGSVLHIEEAGRLLRALPSASSAFASNPRIAPDGLLSLLTGTSPANAHPVGEHLIDLYAALAGNPSIPTMMAAASASNPPSPVLRALVSSVAACPTDPLHAESARRLLASIWRSVDAAVSLPVTEALSAIAHWRDAPESNHTGSAAFEVRQYLWALCGDPAELTAMDDVAKRVGSMMRLVLTHCSEETINRLYDIDSHALLCALNQTPIAHFPDPARKALTRKMRNSPADLAAFHAIYRKIVEDSSPEAMTRPLSRREFYAATEWFESFVHDMAPRLELILERAADDRRESRGVSRTNAWFLAIVSLLAIAELVLTVFILAEM